MVDLLANPVFKKAYDFADQSMVGKLRHSGDSFADHGLNVAKVLQHFHVNDQSVLLAAILHHSVEDGAASHQDVAKEFGEDVAEMIETLNTLQVIKLTGGTEQLFIESLRRMFLTLARDMRIVLIKLSDILDNLQTLNYLRPEKQQRISKETLEIFAPLAERLGMGEMKGQMQDLAFQYLYPSEYAQTQKLLKTNVTALNKSLSQIKLTLNQALAEENIDYRIEARTKHLYSLYTKLKREEIDFDIQKVHDLIAFRIIVNSIEDCYRVLGIIHKLWRPAGNQISDYIANPKSNGYQSIHTKVFGPGRRIFEVQIRTEQMHEFAEYGVAAHWHYAEVKSKTKSSAILDKGVAKVSTKLDWVKQLSQWQNEVADNEEFLKSVKTDFFGKRIYVFTPKGDVKDLPEGATPIDFAYSLHSDLGDIAQGALVNGKMVALNTKLKNTDVCEIIVSKNPKKPNRDWLNSVVTGMAKRRIKKAYQIKK